MRLFALLSVLFVSAPAADMSMALVANTDLRSPLELVYLQNHFLETVASE